jgi:hypothetical protein
MMRYTGTRLKGLETYIYKDGGFLNGKCLENLLGPEAIVPIQVCKMKLRLRELKCIQNAFLHRLSKLGFIFSSKTKPQKFNMETYKLHALGHYADAIGRFGPSDGFSTQTVST